MVYSFRWFGGRLKIYSFRSILKINYISQKVGCSYLCLLFPVSSSDADRPGLVPCKLLFCWQLPWNFIAAVLKEAGTGRGSMELGVNWCMSEVARGAALVGLRRLWRWSTCRITKCKFTLSTTGKPWFGIVTSVFFFLWNHLSLYCIKQPTEGISPAPGQGKWQCSNSYRPPPQPDLNRLTGPAAIKYRLPS